MYERKRKKNILGNTDTKNKQEPFKKLTWKLAVIAKCRTCALTTQEVRKCTITSCPLWGFRLGKQPDPPINALSLTVFRDDPNSVIFRVRKNKDGEDDVVATNKEYPAYIEDDDEEDAEDD